MTKAEEHFHKIAKEIPNAKVGKMFGALCIKNTKGKSFAMMWHDDIVVKLDKGDVANALKLKGAKLFETMEGRPMKEWVQLPFTHAKLWKDLTEKSFEYVAKQVKKK